MLEETAMKMRFNFIHFLTEPHMNTPQGYSLQYGETA